MESVAGVGTIRDKTGKITHLTIEVEKHKELLSTLINEVEKAEKSSFKKKFDAGFTVQQAREISRKRIDDLWPCN